MVEEYEFSPEEEKEIKNLSWYMRIIAVLLVAVGIVSITTAILGGWIITKLLSGVVWIALGISFFMPTDNFLAVVKTKGNDISNLMVGFEELNKGWLIVIILLAIDRLVILMSMFF